jgi:hypothetical protein
MRQPPHWAETILRAVLAMRDREAIPGDLAEAYEEHVVAQGSWRANAWYVRQVLGIGWHLAPRSPKHSSVSAGVLLGLLMALGILITNVLLPLLHVALPENDVANIAVWGFVFAMIGVAGWCAAHRGLRTALTAGGLVALIGFGMAMLTFMIVDNVFFDLVRHEPEKIVLFQQSGYASMRVAITMVQVRALLTVLPVLGALGALIGGLGSVVRKLVR